MMLIPEGFDTCPGASATEMDQIREDLGLSSLPRGYTDFLSTTDGLSSDKGLLYSTHDVVGRNKTFEVGVYSPGFIAIGDDSGGCIYLLSLSAGDRGVYAVDAGTLSPEFHRSISGDFKQWVEAGCVDESVVGSQDEDFPDLVDVTAVPQTL